MYLRIYRKAKLGPRLEKQTVGQVKDLNIIRGFCVSLSLLGAQKPTQKRFDKVTKA